LRAVREALSLALARQEGLFVVGQADDTASAVRIARSLRPDLVLLDDMLPDFSEIDVAATILEERLPARLILLTSTEIDRRVALPPGVSSRVPKAAPLVTLTGAIAEVMAKKASKPARRPARRPARVPLVLFAWTPARRRVMAGMLALLLLLYGLQSVFLPTPVAAYSTLTIFDGVVQVTHAGGPVEPARTGDPIREGDRVHALPGAHAVITFFDKSVVVFEPNSDLTITHLAQPAVDDINVVMTQHAGRSWHVVQHQLGPGAGYKVLTPSAVATVHGTAFQVLVAPDGSTNVTTTDGVVQTGGTDANAPTVQVPPGDVSHVAKGRGGDRAGAGDHHWNPPARPRGGPAAACRSAIIGTGFGCARAVYTTVL